jgi:hypothetical protein
MKKILINIYSNQTIPNYIAIKEIAPDKVIAFATPEYAYQVEVFEELTNLEHELVEIDAYNMEFNFGKIQSFLNKIGNQEEVIVNYTGGTKIMSVSVVLKVLLAANQKLSFVYVNTFGKKLEYLTLSENKILATSFMSIQTIVLLETYISLKKEKIKSVVDKVPNRFTERIELTENLLLNPDLSGLFNKQKSFFEKRGKENILKKSHQLSNSKFEILWNLKKISFQTKDHNFTFEHNDGGQYFSGGWLEEYVFYKLAKTNNYDEVKANVKFDFTSFDIFDKPNSDKIFKNEIDVVLSKGLKTIFIECKAGFVSQDYVYKLQAIRDHFLGTFGVAFLVTKFQQKANIIEKCEDANITLISGDDISNIDRIINKLIK